MIRPDFGRMKEERYIRRCQFGFLRVLERRNRKHFGDGVYSQVGKNIALSDDRFDRVKVQ